VAEVESEAVKEVQALFGRLLIQVVPPTPTPRRSYGAGAKK